MEPKNHNSEPLTPEQIEFLCRGANYAGDPAFSSEAEAKAVWCGCRAQVMACRDQTPGYQSGTRPWAWWRFEQDRTPPYPQGRILDEIGELSPEERGQAIELAREQMTTWTGQEPPEDLNEYLLVVWPAHLRLFDYDAGTRKSRIAAWISARFQRDLTPEDIEHMAVDPATQYASIVTARGGRNR